jgi:hypothetical protein
MISVLLAALIACSPAETPVQEAPATAPVIVEAVPALPIVVETIEVKQAETTAPAATTTPATTTGV